MKNLKELEQQIRSYADLTTSDLDSYYEKTEYANEKVYDDLSVIDRAVDLLYGVGYAEYDGISPSLASDVNFYVDGYDYNDIEIVVKDDVKVNVFIGDELYLKKNPTYDEIKELLKTDENDYLQAVKKLGFEHFVEE